MASIVPSLVFFTCYQFCWYLVFSYWNCAGLIKVRTHIFSKCIAFYVPRIQRIFFKKFGSNWVHFKYIFFVKKILKLNIWVKSIMLVDVTLLWSILPNLIFTLGRYGVIDILNQVRNKWKHYMTEYLISDATNLRPKNWTFFMDGGLHEKSDKGRGWTKIIHKTLKIKEKRQTLLFKTYVQLQSFNQEIHSEKKTFSNINIHSIKRHKSKEMRKMENKRRSQEKLQE